MVATPPVVQPIRTVTNDSESCMDLGLWRVLPAQEKKSTLQTMPLDSDDVDAHMRQLGLASISCRGTQWFLCTFAHRSPFCVFVSLCFWRKSKEGNHSNLIHLSSRNNNNHFCYTRIASTSNGTENRPPIEPTNLALLPSSEGPTYMCQSFGYGMRAGSITCFTYLSVKWTCVNVSNVRGMHCPPYSDDFEVVVPIVLQHDIMKIKMANNWRFLNWLGIVKIVSCKKK